MKLCKLLMELSQPWSERDKRWPETISKICFVSCTHSNGCVKHINSIHKHCCAILNAIFKLLSSIRFKKRDTYRQQGNSNQTNQMSVNCWNEVTFNYLNILTGNKTEDAIVMLLKLSKKCPIELDDGCASIISVRSVRSSLITATIHDILNSPRAQLCVQFLSQTVSMLHHHLIDPLSSLSSFTSSFRIKGSVPEEGGKASIGAPFKFILVVLGWSGDRAEESVEMFDPSIQKWSFYQQETRITRAYHGTVLLGNEIYAIGGFNGNSCKATTLCLNMRSGNWTRKNPMSTPRCYVSTVACKGMIYAIGGHNGINRLKSCEVMLPSQNKWKHIADMMYRRSDAAAAQLNGKIFVSGGFDGFYFHSSVEIYDPMYDDWTLVPSLSNPRSGHSMVAMDGHVFALGGFNGHQRLREVEEFDDEHNCWHSLAPMLIGRSNFCATVFQDEIFVVGGYDGESTTSKVEKFNRSTMEWEIMPSLNVHRSAAGACVVGNVGSYSACSVNEFVPVTSTNIEEPSP